MADTPSRGMFPLDTPIEKMGLDEKEVSLLTGGAKKLTKRSLLILQDTTKAYRSEGEEKVVQVFDQRTGLSLNVGDMTSVAHAFEDMQKRRDQSPALNGAACCCCSCCPCCSCTASVVIEAIC